MGKSEEIHELKRQVGEIVDGMACELIDLSLRIHAAKEIGLEEFESAQAIVEFLRGRGFEVEEGTAGLPTAFMGTFAARQSAKPVIAFLAEYDALPGVGHACGHNVIGASAAGAGAALAALGGALPGSVKVVGTPAEENAGGKIPIVKQGLFGDVGAVLMNHPTSGESRMGGTSLAIHSFQITYRGKPAHAAANPSAGVNALDAACVFLHAVALLRQHVTEDVRLHGIIQEGGHATNIIPEVARVRYLARGAKRSTLDLVGDKVRACIQAGAVATGCEVEIIENKSYEPVKPNDVLSELLRENYAAAGLPITGATLSARGSTDLGEVSQVVPQACAYPSIAPASVAGHSHEFAAAAGGEPGHRVLLASVKAMAWAALDLMLRPELLTAAWEEFRKAE